MQPISEQAILLGPRRSLVAIIAQSAAPAAEKPTIVILNSGIIHRVGANRMSVPLARNLAAAGHLVVRFDLSGIGDSEPRPEALPPADAAIADIREALDTLEASRGAKHFVLMGLCSGADQAAYLGGADPRIAGVVLLEPSLPPPPLHYLRHYVRRMQTRESWWNLFRGRNPLWTALRDKVGAAVRGEPAPRPVKPSDPEVRHFLESSFQRLSERQIPLLVVLTGESWYYRDTFLDAFPNIKYERQLSLEYFPNADHTFGAATERDRLIGRIAKWTEEERFERAR